MIESSTATQKYDDKIDLATNMPTKKSTFHENPTLFSSQKRAHCNTTEFFTSIRESFGGRIMLNTIHAYWINRKLVQ